jgi:hypothetical protein
VRAVLTSWLSYLIVALGPLPSDTRADLTSLEGRASPGEWDEVESARVATTKSLRALPVRTVRVNSLRTKRIHGGRW